MRLRFRIPEEDEEEDEQGAEPDEEPDVEDLVPKALIVALGAAATQVFWPLPAPYLLLFGLIGAATGVAYVLRTGRVGWMAGVIVYGVVNFFMPSDADPSFFLRACFVFVAALGLTVGVGLLIQRGWGPNEDH
jgi:hypothetical protein